MAELDQLIPTILVPLDGSTYAEQGIPFARSVGGLGAKIHLLRVIPTPEALRGLWGGVVVTEAQMLAMSREEAEAEVEKAIADWAFPADRVTSEVIEGDPATVILDRAGTLDADLIVMTTRGRGAIGRWTFGSVADRVARVSPLPVLMVCPTEDGTNPEHPEIRRIVLPLDGSEIALRALPEARAIAIRLRVPVLLVQVINPSSLLTPAGFGMPAHDRAAQEVVDLEIEEARAGLAKSASGLVDAGITVATAIELGPTVDGIEAVLGPGDLIVMSSHGRGGVRRWLLGSVAERLVRDGRTPVLLIPAAERASLTATG